MPDHFEIFRRFLGNFVQMSEAAMADFIQQCQKVEFLKGDYIIKAGEAQKNLYFITKGIVRNYIETNTGEAKLYNFRLENMTVTGYAHYNYKDNLKALVNTQCIEDCIMIQVPLVAIHYVINHNPFGERLGRLLAEAHIIEMLNYIINRDSKSIIERYELLDIEYPNIHQRVPQRMIASYLCITPVHLSNLKKNRKIAFVETNY
jgi:CRP-like cAMP-binding protein